MKRNIRYKKIIGGGEGKEREGVTGVSVSYLKDIDIVF